MKIGFTGTRFGMTQKQKLELNRLLMGASELHHGDCVGADAEAHLIARHNKLNVIIHPPDNDQMRAFCKSKNVLEPKPYLERNKDIVNATEILIAAPDGPEEQRSGTWTTIRYAKKVGKPVVVI